VRNANSQIEAYREERPPKEHENQLLGMIRKDWPAFEGSMLGIGCATGLFIEMMSSQFPNAEYTGFDLSEELIARARGRNVSARCTFEVGDALSFNPGKCFDIVVASGVMSIYDDFTAPLEAWLPWIGDSGTLYIFGCFNSRDIDTIVYFRNNHIGSKRWEGGLTSYSVKTVGDYLAGRGYSANFTPFRIQTRLEEDPNPIRSFTRDTTDGERVLLTGANTVVEPFFLKVTRKEPGS
jgi:hypothetical protein